MLDDSATTRFTNPATAALLKRQHLRPSKRERNGPMRTLLKRTRDGVPIADRDLLFCKGRMGAQVRVYSANGVSGYSLWVMWMSDRKDRDYCGPSRKANP
jgi:hypothetical protein